MHPTKLALAALTPMAAIAISVAAAPSASADTGGLVWPDPTEPYYWDANENAGSTGPAPLPTDDLYWKAGQDAGSTGPGAQPDVPEYTNMGEDAGAV